MSWLALWLVALGAVDLVRVGWKDESRSAPVGVVLLAVLAALTGVTGAVDVAALLVAAIGTVLWVQWSPGPTRSRSGHFRALGVLAATAVLLLAFGGAASPVGGVFGRWLQWADLPLVHDHAPGRVLLVAGLVLVNLRTANLVVRHVLVAAGALRPGALEAPTQPSAELKGGRLLGPMERVVIVGLGLAGQLTAASVVIAAKGLLRFPELQAKRADGSEVNAAGIDAVTEYFLVGSFVSWLLALASLALTR